MKYNDNGTIKEIPVKASDTLPIGSIVEFDGDTIPDGWEVLGAAFEPFKFLGTVNTGGSNSFSLTSPDLSEYNGCYLIVATKGAEDGANSGVWFARSGFKAVAKVVSTGSSEIALDITKNGDTINGVFQGDMSYCYVRVYKI